MFEPATMAVTHHDFMHDKYFSVWLGNPETEEEIDGYIRFEDERPEYAGLPETPSEREYTFEKDFGFLVYPPSGAEGNDITGERQSVRALLEECYRVEKSVDAAVEAAAAKGWTEATVIFTFPYLKYDPAFIRPNPSGLLTFIGAFPYDPEAVAADQPVALTRAEESLQSWKPLEPFKFPRLSPLYVAARSGDIDVVTKELDAGASVDAVDEPTGLTPLVAAANGNRLRVLRLLLSRGADPNLAGHGGTTALQIASRAEQGLEAVTLLLQHGADINYADRLGSTPLLWAARNRCRRVMRFLIARGANVNCWDHTHRVTPLIQVTAHGMAPQVRLLIEAGADVNHRSADGKTALDIARERKNDALIELLQQAGAVEGQSQG